MDQYPSLQTAVWIYDIDEHMIRWANEAALKWWQAKCVESLNQRDFAKNTSDAVKQALAGYQERFDQGNVICDVWQFSPLGVNKQAFCQFSGYQYIDEAGLKHKTMLVEATPLETLSPAIESQSAIIIASIDESGQLLSCNPPFKETFGKQIKHIEDITVSIAHNDTATELSESGSQIWLQRVRQAKGDVNKLELLLQTMRGERWFQVQFSAPKLQTDSLRYLLHLTDIDERKANELNLIEQTRSDVLTGALNRKGLRYELEKCIDRDKAFHVFYIDLDGFKMINDSLGHSTGDLVLHDTARRLESLSLTKGLISRFGGDEFIVAITSDLSQAEQEHVASQIVQVLSEPFSGEQENLLLISASVGLAAYPKDANTLDDVVRYADAAMYRSKQLGKKRWTKYEKGMENAILRKSLVAQYLSSAIDNNELRLYYQPILDTSIDQIFSFEALLRWEHHELGYVNPQEAISVAEDIGMIEKLENWVIKTALSDLKKLRRATSSNASMSINISALHIESDGLASYLQSQLREYALHSTDLIVEITESTLLSNLDNKNSAIDTLTERGIKIAIDDFGTGYSSLAYLHNIDASIVKIDKAFLSEKSGCNLTLSAIKTLIHALNLRPLIEGVETQEMADMCKEIGIELQQGYWHCRPQALDWYVDKSLEN
ncbi:putative bifunctional diguanylate cyclase/phosphodiesterase [Ningiella sp. W23]|uniref:putative bifunctional diguanylate cyclase/phosphodiesterase n=1 Tax=Ningiella sp. W23 TaxID=3023715 RepID=UPI00375798C4